MSLKLGRRLKFLVGKPGLDGHSNGAEQIAMRATDAGMEVVYDGIRLTPAEIVERAQVGRPLRRPVDLVGLASGADRRGAGEHARRGPRARAARRRRHHPAGRRRAASCGRSVAAVYTPKDFKINAMIGDIVAEVETRFDAETAPAKS